MHRLSDPLLIERPLTVREGDEVVLYPDEWITTEAHAVLTAHNYSARPASALHFRVIPLHPSIAADL